MSPGAPERRTLKGPAGGAVGEAQATGTQDEHPLDISGRLLVRNGLLDIVVQVVPLVIGLLSVPTIVHGMGMERFGLLVFTWTLIGAFSVVDLGLGWSVTKLAAEALGRRDPTQIPGIVWPAVAGQGIMGVLGAAAIAYGAPLLVLRFLHVAPDLQAEAIRAFRITALSLPVVLMTVSFRGLLEAGQRFDLTAGVKATNSSTTFLVPLWGVMHQWSLPDIVSLLLATRVLLLGVLIVLAIRCYPLLIRPWSLSVAGLGQQFTFGGWVTLSALTGLIIVYADRVIIGGALTMSAVTQYAVPQDLVGRLGLISAALAAVLVPAFSTLKGAGDLSRLQLLLGRSLKYVVLSIVPGFALLVIFAHDLLRVWLGPDLAARSALVLQVLAVGAALQVIAVILASVVQGVGRPDLIAKFLLMEMPLYLGAMWWLVQRGGIEGAALMWSGRVALHGLLLLGSAVRLGLWSPSGTGSGLARVVVPIVALCALVAWTSGLPLGTAPRAVLAVGVTVGFYVFVWVGVLRADERDWFVRLVSGWRRQVA